MTESWVVNASPLIFLSRIGRLDLLEKLAASVLVPDAVIREVSAGGAKDSAAKSAVEWAAAWRVADRPVPTSVASWDLGEGETQVVAHCLADQRVAVLDDLTARRAASAHGMDLIGTLGVVLRAKRHGLISELRPLIEHLRVLGLYADEQLIQRILTAADE